MTTIVLDHVEVHLSVEQVITALRPLSETERLHVWHEFQLAEASIQTIQTIALPEAHEARWRKRIEQWEQQHRAGYERYPVTADEFDVWLPEQAWGDE